MVLHVQGKNVFNMLMNFHAEIVGFQGQQQSGWWNWGKYRKMKTEYETVPPLNMCLPIKRTTGWDQGKHMF